MKIPEYQRPYKWSSTSVNTLFTDIQNAMNNHIEEYRLGSIILQRQKINNEFIYNIVDGQQRTTTLIILLYVLGERENSFLKENFKKSSVNPIIDSLELLTRRVRDLDNIDNFKCYILEQCSVVKIVTDSEQEAFQFFDSQNSRGKALKPHDLLKSYHLREMKNDEEKLKLELISKWENTDQNNLEDLFKTYLYPTINWYKNRHGLNYGINKMDAFKGVKQTSDYAFAIYHKASNIFVEQFNNSGSNELLNTNYLNQYQLTQPIISGKRFFTWTLHYYELLDKVRKTVNNKLSKELMPDKRTGDIYIKQLFESVLLFFVDRFGIETLNLTIIMQFYTWAYSLRIMMYAVYPETVNKYAKGEHKRVNFEKNLFNMISEMQDPKELEMIIFEEVQLNGTYGNGNKYEPIYSKIAEWNGWSHE